MGIIQDLEKDVEGFFVSIPDSVKAQVAKLKTDAGQLMQGLAATAAKDITAGGILNTASYVTAAKDILAQVIATGASVILPDVFSILNAEVACILDPPVG